VTAGDHEARRRLKLLVAPRVNKVQSVVVAMVVVGLSATGWSWFEQGSNLADRWVLIAPLLVLMVQGHARLRYRHNRETEDLNLFEATLAVAFVALAPADAALLAGVATGIAVGLQRIELLKSVFNTAQWILSALVGGLVFHAVATGSTLGNTTALVAAVVAAFLTNHALLALILGLATGQPLAREDGGSLRSVLTGRLVGLVASLSLGLLLSGAYSWNSWLITCAFVPLGLLHWANKGYAIARVDRVRLEGLQRATHALSIGLDREETLKGFLAEVRECFEVRAVELLVHHDGGWTSFSQGTGSTATPAERTTQLLALVGDVPDATRAVAGKVNSDALAAYLNANAARDAIVAPLGANDRRVGVLCILDRVGMEGFEDGEIAVATALAAELVGYLERATLVDQLFAEQTTMARIVEQTSDGIVTLSPRGVIRTWNAAMAAVTGYAANEMVGTKHLGVLRARDESGADVWLENWAKLDHLPERLQIRASSGESRWLSCSFTRADGGDEGEATLIMVARDVTGAHELERLKDDFVAVVSHELRTPLVPIKGWASMLLARGDRLTAEQRRDALESIQAQAQRLERLVLNILDASRIEGGLDSSNQTVDVSLLAARVVDEMLPSAATHAIRLHGANRPVLAIGQAVWVERALANLLANAVKYAPADTNIDVNLCQEAADIVVRVTDEGPGIPTGWADRIFGRFERVPEGSTQTGTGLGLYITRQLVAAMGGSVEVESTSSTGTVFCMRLRASMVHVPVPRTRGSFQDVGAETLI
jgi:PAS domain S-box-containing protein